MNIQLQSQMLYGDEAGMKDFMFVHRLVHSAVDAYIASKTSGQMPNAALDSGAALDGWLSAMRQDEETKVNQDALQDWLKWHAALHQDEYSSLGLGYAPELGVVDFSKEQQFYDWMLAHSEVHDTLNQAAGVTT